MRTVKNVFDIGSEGTMKIGSPKQRLEYGVIQDIRALGMKNLRNVVMSRENWLKILKKVKSIYNCQTSDVDDCKQE
jgi:hypothetical protein